MNQQQMQDHLTALPDDVLYLVVSLLPYTARRHLQQSCRKLYFLSKESHFYRGLDHLSIRCFYPPEFLLCSTQERFATSFKTLARSEYPGFGLFFNLVTLAAPHIHTLSFEFCYRSTNRIEHEPALANLILAIFEHMAAHWPHVIRQVDFDLFIILNGQSLNFVRQMQESLARFPNLRILALRRTCTSSSDDSEDRCKQFIAGAFPHLSEVTLIRQATLHQSKGLLPLVEQLTLQRNFISDAMFENLDGISRHARLHFRECHGTLIEPRTYHLPYLTDLTFDESTFIYGNHGFAALSPADEPYVRAFYDILEAPNLRHLRLTGSCGSERDFSAFMCLDWDRIGQKYPLLESIAVTTSTVYLLSKWPHLPTYTVSVQKLLACASRLPNLTHLHLATYEIQDNAVKPLTESVWRDILDVLQAGCPKLQSIWLPFLCERFYADWLLDLFEACRSLRRIHCDTPCAGVGWTQNSCAKCQEFITNLAERLHNADVVHSIVLSGPFFVRFPGLSQSLERMPLTEKFPSVNVAYAQQYHIIYKTTGNVV